VLARAAWSRKAGRYDFERFDHLSSTGVSVGNQAIDKVNVDCCFLFRRSQWGTLGQNGIPAGIIYMDLTFDQPIGCKLVNAKVRVTLDEKRQELERYRGSMRSEYPVQFTDWFGPKQFSGVEKMKATKKTIHATPNINVLGNGAGGVGVDFETAFVHTSNWTFKGSRQPEKGSSNWAYKTLTWELTENDLERHPVHSNKIHTAFAYESGGQPLLMRVEISGQLVKTRQQLKEKMKGLMRFGPRKDEDIATTLIGSYHGRRRRLDEWARGLERSMEQENRNSVPMEMPDSQRATFQQMPYEPNRLNHNAIGTNATAEIIFPDPTGRLSGQPQVQLEDEEPPGLLEDCQARGRTNLTDPTLDNLARIGAYFTTPPRHLVPNTRVESSESCSEASGHSSGTTLVESQSGLTEVSGEESVRESLGLSDFKKVDDFRTAERQTVMGVLWLLLEVLISSMLATFRSMPWTTKHDIVDRKARENPDQKAAAYGSPNNEEGLISRPKRLKGDRDSPGVKAIRPLRSPS